MSTSRSPVGPLPPKVYWRRRIVVGLGLLAVIVAIVLIVVRPGQGGATPPSDPPASSPAKASADPDTRSDTEPDDAGEEQPAGSALACTAASVTVEAVMDKENYAAGVLPQLSLKVTNTSETTPCLLSAGTDMQEYRITSGSDLIWSSTHCLKDPQPSEITLKPKQSVSTPPIEWSRERSDPTTCEDEERAPAVGGGATYVLQVIVGDLESEQNRFVLL